MTKHTPGPWEADSHMQFSPGEGSEGHGLPDWLILCGGPHEIAQVSRRYHNGRLPEVEAANARLMAAAPDLLAALESAESWMSEHDKNCSGGREIHDDAGDDCPLCVVRSALAKARGEGRSDG